MRVLILCTGNSCRSQMAEGFLKSFDPTLEVFSAGTRPEQKVNPYAVRAMKEALIDISGNKPAHVDQYVHTAFDFVITVCDHAKEVCPLFTGQVGQRLHIGFEDPAAATGTDEEKMPVYRRIRDQIKNEFFLFYKNQIKSGR